MKKIILFFIVFLLNQLAYSQWQMMNSPGGIVNDMIVLSNGKILACTNHGLFISNNDGLTWDSTSLTTEAKLIKIDNNGVLYTNSYYLYRSTNDGLNWSPCNQTSNVSNFFINDSNYIYMVEPFEVMKSTNQGNSWKILYERIVQGGDVAILYGICEHSGSVFFSYRMWGYIVGGGWYDDKRLLKNTNEGYPYPWSMILNEKIVSNIYFFNDTMYLATQGYGILKSTDYGTTFTQLITGLNHYYINKIIRTKNNVLICTAGDGIYRSLDNGNYWQKLDTTGLISANVNGIYSTEDGKLYACTNNGIYIFIGELPVELSSFTAQVNTGNIMLQWATVTETNNRGFEIERKTENLDWRVIGFKQGKGTTTEPQEYSFFDDLFEVNGTELSYRLKQIDYDGSFEYSPIVEVGINTPFKFELSQNYPNPFNPSTKISWRSPVSSRQTLRVYDVLGNEVAILVDEYKPAGNYEVEFQSSVGSLQLASGIYFYQLKAGNPESSSGQGFVETKKMILLR